MLMGFSQTPDGLFVLADITGAVAKRSASLDTPTSVDTAVFTN